MALMCSDGTKKSHFYSMPPLHRAAAKDGEKAAKSCLCRAVGAVEAAAPQILVNQLTLSHTGRGNYAPPITICPPPPRMGQLVYQNLGGRVLHDSDSPVKA